MRLMNIELRNGLGQRLSSGEAMIHTGLYLFLSASMILQLVSIGLIAGLAPPPGSARPHPRQRSDQPPAYGACANQRRKNVLQRGPWLRQA
jgi:hypothetical protein